MSEAITATAAMLVAFSAKVAFQRPATRGCGLASIMPANSAGVGCAIYLDHRFFLFSNTNSAS